MVTSTFSDILEVVASVWNKAHVKLIKICTQPFKFEDIFIRTKVTEFWMYEKKKGYFLEYRFCFLRDNGTEVWIIY